ncbi:spore germination protein GerW family protein [Nocardia brevicatena]|uniref:spore germination protein GerW family protein n=1 Tax=Nocardia brevicatena TaxID=37327 RepID=UPI000303E8D3|nr:spore germination protein GerW family protein [Nocardia brevicatena]
MQSNRNSKPSDARDYCAIAAISPFVDYLVTDKGMFSPATAGRLNERRGATVMRRLADLRQSLELDPVSKTRTPTIVGWYGLRDHSPSGKAVVGYDPTNRGASGVRANVCASVRVGAMNTRDSKSPAEALEPSMAAAEASTGLLERLAERLGARASAKTVFGEPITAHGITIVPVARAGFGFGGGSGREIGSEKSGEGGGGGGGVDVRPLGFIEIRNGTATYRPIHGSWVDVVVPFTAILTGAAIPRILRARKRRRSRRIR